MMKKTSKKALSLFLAVLMLMSTWAVGVSAETVPACEQHNFEKKVIVPATCTSTGAEALVCTVCGTVDKTSYEEIPTAAHQFVKNEESSYAAECNKTGLTKYNCENCSATKEIVIPAKAHTLANPVVIKAATCKEDGIKQEICTKCGFAVHSPIAKLTEHQRVVEVPAVEAKCYQEGWSAWSHCMVCNEILVPSVRTEPLPHDYIHIEDSYLKEPTCTKEGEIYEQCSVKECKAGRIVTLPATGHKDDNSDGICDTCNNFICTCICHKDNFISKLVRYFNTFFNIVFKKEADDPTRFRCCDCMEPYTGL